MVQLLLKHRASASVVDVRGRRPLHVACIHDRLRVAEALVRWHAQDPSVSLEKTLLLGDRSGDTALHMVCLISPSAVQWMLFGVVVASHNHCIVIAVRLLLLSCGCCESRASHACLAQVLCGACLPSVPQTLSCVRVVSRLSCCPILCREWRFDNICAVMYVLGARCVLACRRCSMAITALCAFCWIAKPVPTSPTHQCWRPCKSRG